MRYMGSKSRIVDKIAPILQYFVSDGNLPYYEPFCGGCNVIDHINAVERFASDNQKYLIALYQNLDKVSGLPKFITKDHYLSVRHSFNKKDNKYEDWYIGAIGFLASYNGKFFDGGYAGIVHTKTGVERNYYDEAKRNLEKQIPNLKGIHFKYGDYLDTCKNLEEFVIYCDPPYYGTTQYSSSKNFNHNIFWEWVRYMSMRNIVIVSEHQAPDDFKCIWEQNITRTLNNNRVKSTEKLFMKI